MGRATNVTMKHFLTLAAVTFIALLQQGWAESGHRPMAVASLAGPNDFYSVAEKRLLLNSLREAAENAQSEDGYGEVSEKCSQAMAVIFANSALSTPMLDAFGKIPAGILRGNTMWVGSYPECQQLSYTHYCLVTVTLPVRVSNFTPSLPVKWGACMPKECSSHDVTSMLLNGTDVIPYIGQYINANPNTTHTLCEKAEEYNAGAIATFVILGIFGALMLIGTTIDWFWELLYEPEKDGNTILNSDPKPFIFSRTNGDLHDRDLPGEKANKPILTKRAAATEETPLVNSNSITRKGYEHDGLLWNVTSTLRKAQQSGRGSSGVVSLLKFFLCFSMIRNGRNLLKTDVPDGAIECVNGIRVLSILWVVLGHVHLLALSYSENPMDILEVAKRFTFQTISNAYFAVDSFFVLSGLLVMYLTLKHMKRRRGKFPWVEFYLHRFWRLTPAYMFVIMIWTNLAIHASDGPLWHTDVDPQVELCNSRWWTNLLYINNFYPTNAGTNEQCLAWGWYLANDMQFYVFSPIVIIAFYKSPKLGAAIVSAILSIGFIVTGVIWHHYGFLTGTPSPFPKGHFPPPKADQSNVYYVKPYTRMAPYLVGLVLGYIILEKPYLDLYRSLEAMISSTALKVLRIVAALAGWCIAGVLFLSTLYGLYGVVQDETYLPPTESIIYNTFSRFAWGIGLAWLIFACHIKLGSCINSLLSFRFWIPLSRLSYSVYLLHPLPVGIMIFGLYQPLPYKDATLVFLFLGAAMASFLGATVIYLAVEAPFQEMEKLLFKRKHNHR